MQGLSFHRFLCCSSVSCQLCSCGSFRPIIDARRCQSSLNLNESRPWMRPAGGWRFADGCWQRMFLLLSRIKLKVHSAESGFPKRVSQTPQSTWPWLNVCIIGVVQVLPSTSWPVSELFAHQVVYRSIKSIQGPQKLSSARTRCSGVVIPLVLFMWSSRTGLGVH